MWKIIPRTLVRQISNQSKRTFLSDAYKCTDAWNARLATPILQKISVEPFYYELDQKFQQLGKCSAIDIDIFANRLTNDNFIEELTEAVHKLRMTEETTNASDSMSHALIRLYLQSDNTKELLNILNNRIGYGVFLDNYTANLLMDHLIKAKDYVSAAKVACFMMLQEDFSNPITIGLSLFACVKFCETPNTFEPKPEPAEETTAAAKTPAGAKKKVEEVKVRVGFVRNPYFDDHFDLVDSQQMVGKTLTAIGKALADNAMAPSLQLLGLCLHQKYDVALEYVSSARNVSFYKDALRLAGDILSQASSDSATDEVRKQLTDSVAQCMSVLIEDDFEKAVCKFANDQVAKFEKTDIEAQIKTYNDWLTLRETKLADELDRLHRARRLTEIEKMRKEMEKEEEKLWFFENEDKIDLKIDSKRVFYPKKWFGKIKKPRAVDVDYVPPEIGTKQLRK